MNSISPKLSKSLSVFFIISSIFYGERAIAQCSALTPLASVCENAGNITLTGGTPLGGVYFGPGVSGTAPYTFNPATAGGPGIYQIGYTGPACGDTAYRNITVNAAPAVSFTAPGPFCSNRDSVVLTGGSPVPPPGSSYYFGPGVNSSNKKFDPGIGGGTQVLSYTFTAANGCKDTATATVTIHNVVPAGFTGLDTAYCLETPSPIAVTPVSPNPGTFGPATLFTGSNFNIPAVPGYYNVYYFYSDINGCTDSSKKTVHIRNKPNVTFTLAPSQTSKCDKDPAFPISTAGANPPGGTFSGTGVIGGSAFDPATSGVGTFKIIYTATGTFGCINKDSSQFITVNPSPTVSFVPPFDSLCQNAPKFQLPNGTVNGVSSPGVYSGLGVSPTPAPQFFNPQTAGPGSHPVTFTGTSANGCSASFTKNIKVNPTPVVNFTNTIRKCANDSAFTLNVGLPLGGTYFGVGVLPDGQTFDPATTLGAGSYQLFYTYTDPKGCSDTNQQFITLDTFPQINVTSLPNPAKICFGDTAELTATSIPSNNVAFSWAPNLGDIDPPSGTGDNIRTFPAQDKSITLTGIYKNCSNTTTIEIDVIEPATAIVSGDLEICYGDSTVLTASGASTYEWSHGDLTASTVVAPIWDTTYQVIALSEKDGNGKQCSEDTTDVIVIVNPLPMVSAGLDTVAFIGDILPLTGHGATTYEWSGLDTSLFSCLVCPNSTVKILPDDNRSEFAVYYVKGTDDNGCTNSDSIIVTLDEKIIVFVPTAFSPNNDGSNDSLYVRTKGVKAITFQIFNRRGEEVFSTKNVNEGWDGMYMGSPLNKEVFVYYLTVTPYIKSAFKQTGSVTLVR